MACTCCKCGSCNTAANESYKEIIKLSKEVSNTFDDYKSEIDQAVNAAEIKIRELYENLSNEFTNTFENAEALLGIDGEDIMLNEDDMLRDADRDRDPSAFIGKGWKILRRKKETKDCDCCDCEECSKVVFTNILTQDDFSKSNTIYVIRYDFDLNGRRIVLPVGCELRFEGGSFTNGEIDLNGGKITGMSGDINDYFYNVEVDNFDEGQIYWKDGDIHIWKDGDTVIVPTEGGTSNASLDAVQTAINSGCGVSLPMPSANSGKISLPMKTMTLSEYKSITPVSNVIYNIID